MKYEKPEVAVNGCALVCIQTFVKPLSNRFDLTHTLTANAYEADE